MEADRIQNRLREIDRVARQGGYQLNPDEAFTLRLAEGLLKNAERYGVEACPCRLYTGEADDNLDVICPCYYRDDDLAEYGACFCALYVTGQFHPDKQIPDRRKKKTSQALNMPGTLAYPVWRCRVCGYLCARNSAPSACPICKAGSERFERFL